MPAVLRWHDFEFRGHVLWCDFCTIADGCQCGIWGSSDSQWIRVMPWFGTAFFRFLREPKLTEVTSETLLVDSPLFKCLTWVSGYLFQGILM